MEIEIQNSDFLHIFFLIHSAFQTMYNCQSTLMHLVESWKRALDRGENVGAIMMDISKAVDYLSHEMLIAKRSSYGFSNNACDFILNYCHVLAGWI